VNLPFRPRPGEIVNHFKNPPSRTPIRSTGDEDLEENGWDGQEEKGKLESGDLETWPMREKGVTRTLKSKTGKWRTEVYQKLLIELLLLTQSPGRLDGTHYV
jgi:hypothetical protein